MSIQTRDHDPDDQGNQGRRIKFALNSGKTKEAALLAYKYALKCIEWGHLAGAMYYQFKTAYILEGFLGDPECDRAFISASLSLSDLYMYIRKRDDEILSILQQAKEVSQRMGDERHLALIDLHMGRLYHTRHELPEALRLFNLGIKAVRKLGDEDMRVQSAEFLGLYYFIQGMSKEAAENFDLAMSANYRREGQVFNNAIPAYLGSCAAFRGQFYRAIGVLDSSWRRALTHSDHIFSQYLRSHLGNILLMMGKGEDALIHLMGAEKEAQAHKDIWVMVSAQRALAYYHFLEGRPQDSYTTLRKCLTNAASLGYRRPYYDLPWIIELLFEYHKRGFEPIPEYDFEREIEIAIKGVNIHLRGTALRIRAKLGEMREEASGRIEAFLKRSERDLDRVQDPIELAKTRVELAQLKLRQGQRQEALDFALLAWEGLSGYGHASFPHELKSLIQHEGSLLKARNQGEEVLRRYMEMVDEFIPSADADELLTRLLTATSRFFQAERGAIFWMSDDKIKPDLFLRTSYNLSQEEVASEEFRSNLNHLSKAFRNNQPLIVRLPQSGHDTTKGHQAMTILCLPIELRGQVLGVLYHDNRYVEGGFEFPDKSMLKQIAQNVGTYILRIREYCKQVEQKSLLALRETTVSEELEDEVIKTQSNVMRELLQQADRVAKSEAPALILGETGVGKELLARRLHKKSSRQAMPFIAVNLASIPETLIESELFGHEKGAFTGAISQKPGRLELANKGTLFIDEVGDMPKSVQVKLLRALEEKAFFRVGGFRNINSDFRLIAATNKDLLKEVESGNFREDLYYRLNVVPLIIPPLRDRGNDVILLAQHYLTIYAREYNRTLPELSFEDRERLKTHHWPGNVRELKNVIERSMILSSGDYLELSMPGKLIKSTEISNSFGNPFADRPTMEELQRRYINYILKSTGGKLGGPGSASAILGMKRTTLYTRMKKLGLL